MKWSRREFMKAGAATGAAALVGGCTKRVDLGPTQTPGRTFVGAAADYGVDLVPLMVAGLKAFPNLAIRGKSVLLKPNLVETTSSTRPINTHPMVVVAAAEAFLKLGAKSVTVADGPGHQRDIELILAQSGMGEALKQSKLPFVDLNHDRVGRVKNAGRRTTLEELHLPVTVLESDLVVSVAKLKTHHWAGATLTLKNCFGLMPGIVYGWPKNVLHRIGRPAVSSIPQSIMDIAVTAKPGFGIIDGIVGMEGDGPIMGTAKPVGCVVMGDQLGSVDATGARIMGFHPHRIGYLRDADASGLGGTNPLVIQQMGEPIARFATDFAVLPQFNSLKQA